MSAAPRLADDLAQVVSMTAAGRIVRRVCACGQCGVEFETPVRKGQQRLYAEGCSVRAAQVRAINQASSERAYRRLSARSPRRCHCGCGRVLPARVWYHPECKEAALATRNRDGARKRAPTEGRRCGCCQGQSWRRHPELGCIRCGQAYAPETIKRPPASIGCGIAQIG